MTNASMTALAAVEKFGSELAASQALGIPRTTFRRRVREEQVALLARFAQQPSPTAQPTQPASYGIGTAFSVNAMASWTAPAAPPPAAPLALPEMTYAPDPGPARSIDNSVIMAFGDFHAPYHHPDAFDFIVAGKQKFKPTRFIGSADEIDWASLPKKDRSPNPNMMNPSAELEEARAFFHRLEREFPVVDCLHSNHTSRYRYAASQAGVPSRALVSPGDLLFADMLGDGRYHRPKGRGLGWRWSDDIVIDLPNTGMTKFIHGASENLGTLPIHEGMNVVQGHFHTLSGVRWVKPRNYAPRFALALGCLADPSSSAFAYTKGQGRMAEEMLSFGIIIDGVPHLVPMLLNENGRWIGEIIGW